MFHDRPANLNYEIEQERALRQHQTAGIWRGLVDPA